MEKTINTFFCVSTFALLCVGMTTSAMAFTQSIPPSSHRAIYMDGDIGWSLIDLNSGDYSDPYTGAPPTSLTNTSLAWAFDAGYQFNRNIGMEAGYISFGTASANTSILGTPANEKDMFSGFDLMMKGILPVTNKFNIFGKMGTVDMNDDATLSDSTFTAATIRANGSAWTLLWGLGASYNINSNFAINFQDLYSVGTTYQSNGSSTKMPNLNALMAGLSYKLNL